MHKLIRYRRTKQEERYVVEFAKRHELKIMNTFFNTRLSQRWIWISPNRAAKNEIDYSMADKPDIFLDVSVINSLNASSDHRMIGGTTRIDTNFWESKTSRRTEKNVYMQVLTWWKRIKSKNPEQNCSTCIDFTKRSWLSMWRNCEDDLWKLSFQKQADAKVRNPIDCQRISNWQISARKWWGMTHQWIILLWELQGYS